MKQHDSLGFDQTTLVLIVPHSSFSFCIDLTALSLVGAPSKLFCFYLPTPCKTILQSVYSTNLIKFHMSHAYS